MNQAPGRAGEQPGNGAGNGGPSGTEPDTGPDPVGEKQVDREGIPGARDGEGKPCALANGAAAKDRGLLQAPRAR